MTRVAGGLPGTALSYVWASGIEPGTMTPSPFADAVVMVALESGDAKAGTWITAGTFSPITKELSAGRREESWASRS